MQSFIFHCYSSKTLFKTKIFHSPVFLIPLNSGNVYWVSPPFKFEEEFQASFFRKIKTVCHIFTCCQNVKFEERALFSFEPTWSNTRRQLAFFVSAVLRHTLSLLIDTSECQSFSDSFYFRSREQGDLSPNSEINCWVKLSL